jgi:hypothetical protein
MPNHISNIVKFQSPDDDYKAEDAAFKLIQTLMKTDESPFDFNVLIPYPEVWSVADEAHRKARDNAYKDKTFAGFDSLPVDGFNHGGYEWCCTNWGTKWNAYDIAYQWDTVTFNTAWSTPEPIWRELSRRFPTLNLVVDYADEDTGSNCRHLVYRNGIEDEAESFDEHDFQNMPDPTMFARAIKAEHEAADNWQQYQEAQKRIKELEAELILLKTPDDKKEEPSV